MSRVDKHCHGYNTVTWSGVDISLVGIYFFAQYCQLATKV
jgi:hypothetical protein